MGLTLDLPGANGDYASTPDAVANSITGDIEIIAKITPSAWTNTQDSIVGKRQGSSGEFQFRLSAGGNQLELNRWNGSTGQFVASSGSTLSSVFGAGETGWVRVTQDVDDGASDSTTTFYTSSNGHDWTQFGTARKSGAVIVATDTTNGIAVGAQGANGFGNFDGTIQHVTVINGIGGTIAVNFNANDAPTPNATSWTSAATGELWTLNGNAALVGFKESRAVTMVPVLHALGDL